MPGPSSQISTTTSASRANARIRISPLSVHGVDRVVQDVRPDLVELAPERLDLRQVRLVVADDGDPGLELRAQDHQRVVQPGADVHALHRGLVHERVLLDRLDDLGDAPGTGRDLVHERVDRAAGGDPGDDAAERVARERRLDALEVGAIPPATDERRGELAGLGHAALGEERLQLPRQVAGVERVERRPACRRAEPPRRASSATNAACS